MRGYRVVLVTLALLSACHPLPPQPPLEPSFTIGFRAVDAATSVVIPKATVRYWFTGNTPEAAAVAETNYQGRVFFKVPGGVTASHVWVTASGYQPFEQHVDARPGLELVVQLAANPPPRPMRQGRVRLEGHTLVDETGPFLGHGATLFWGLWGYQHDRARLEQNLAYLADSRAIDHVRVLASVGGDWWADRHADPNAPDYDQALAELTDLVYDKYGMRTEWTIFGGVEDTPTAASREMLVDRVLAMTRGREEKVILLETANEAAGNGFGGAAGLAELRQLTRRMNDATSILVAASSIHEDPAAFCDVYGAGVADIATIHFDRDIGKAEGVWRPVRQPWGYPGEFPCDGLPPGDSNEPIGPYSSVAEERDPTRLVAQAVVAHIAGLPLSVLHTGPGIWGGGKGGQARGIPANLWDTPGLTDTLKGLAAVTAVLPPRLASWSKQNSGWAGTPFGVDAFWPEGGTHGAVRVYSATQGTQFVTAAIGVRGYVELTPRWPMSFELRPMRAGETATYTVKSGETVRLSEGSGAWLLIGQ